MTYQKPVNILLIEDDPADAELAKRGFSQAKAACVVHHVFDGDAGISFLKRKNGFENAPKIQLVILDLNLPGKDGKEILREIKKDSALTQIPVIILSTSQSPNDIQSVYQLGANAYMSKSVDFSEFVRNIGKLAEYWFEVVKIPA